MIKTVLIDLSGTLHIENTVTQSAVAALEKLRKASLSIKFVTNTTKESRKFLFDRLKKLGFQLTEDEIFTSLQAAKALIQMRGWRKPMLLLEPAALEDFTEFQPLKDHEEADSVVIGLSPSQFCYPVLNTAFRRVLSGAPLVAIHKARYFKEPDGGLSLGPGGFVSALEYAADCKAEIVGKPEPSFFLSALGSLKPEEAVMIGDDARDDVQGAQKCGIRGILCRTGKYREGDETKISPPPFAVCDNFAEAVEKILKDTEKC